jgi:hypothetical protein
VDRDGARLGQIVATPGSVRIERGADALLVTCAKPGYETAHLTEAAKFTGVMVGNLPLGGSADYIYPPQININLAEAGPPAVPVPPVTTQALPPLPRR